MYFFLLRWAATLFVDLGIFLSLHYQHPVDSVFVTFFHNCARAQVTFELGRFLGFDMGALGMMSHNLACAGNLETLGSGTVSFDLGHIYLLNNTNKTMKWKCAKGIRFCACSLYS